MASAGEHASPMPDRHRKRWIETADFRHATDGLRPTVGDTVATLCGETATVILAVPGMYAPECPRCDVMWRDQEGIEQRSAHLPKPTNSMANSRPDIMSGEK